MPIDLRELTNILNSILSEATSHNQTKISHRIKALLANSAINSQHTIKLTHLYPLNRYLSNNPTNIGPKA